MCRIMYLVGKKTLIKILAVSIFGGLLGVLFVLPLVKGQLQKENGLTDIAAPILRPLDKYTITNLSQTSISPGEMVITTELAAEESYASYLFEYEHNPSLDGKTLKTITGQINIPTESPKGIVLLLRGYINQQTYTTGDGSRNVATYFAQNGFITVAPDFLGYAGSDTEAGDIFESRFQTYTTAISLYKLLTQLPGEAAITKSASLDLEVTTLFSKKYPLNIWGHSNGGQIALTLLETTGATNKTVLWAPVSKAFPYSILYYTDESDDRGKFIRAELASFEEKYDVDLYSLDLYLGNIQSPLLIHQGTSDDAVPVAWTDDLTDTLEELEKDFVYRVHIGADHNMRPAWDNLVAEDILFFDALD